MAKRNVYGIKVRDLHFSDQRLLPCLPLRGERHYDRRKVALSGLLRALCAAADAHGQRLTASSTVVKNYISFTGSPSSNHDTNLDQIGINRIGWTDELLL